jgi:ribosomal protein L20A (L18A)
MISFSSTTSSFAVFLGCLYLTSACHSSVPFFVLICKNHLCSYPYKFCMLYQIFERNPTTIKNYGIWLRYQSRTGYHNMYKEYRDTTLNGAVEQMYNEMASRHRVRSPCIQIIKTATVHFKLCKRDNTKQFHNSEIKFPLVHRKVRPPTRKLRTTFKASRPNLFM